MNTIHKIILGTTFLFASTVSPSQDAGQAPVILTDNQGRYLIGRDIEYFEDTGKTVTIDDIIKQPVNPGIVWKKSEKEHPSFGWSKSRYWFRFNVSNESKRIPDDMKRWTLVFDYPLLDSVKLYTIQNNLYKVQETGFTFPFNKREFTYRNFAFNLSTEPGTRTCYYISFETTSSFDLTLWILSTQELSKRIVNEQMMLGLYYGLMILIAIYSFFLFLSIRDTSYLFYILWILAYGFYQASINGLVHQYILPDLYILSKLAIPVCIFAGATATLQFGNAFLKMKENLPLLNKIIQFMIIYNITGIIATFFIPYAIAVKLGSAMVVFMSGLLMISGFVSLKRGFRAARLYIIAWSMQLIGVGCFAFKAFGLIPVNFFTNWSQQIGSALQVTLLSLALAPDLPWHDWDEWGKGLT